MTIRTYFQENPSFITHNNIFFQRDLYKFNSFEQFYLSLREKENRIYTDDAIKLLPEFPSNHPLTKEWLMRKFTFRRLIRYLDEASEEMNPSILEIGCGNGWLCNHLAAIRGSEVLGIDVNKTELEKASAVFQTRKNLTFACADILTATLPYASFDYIVLSACIQYFSDLNRLFEKLFTVLSPRGEIHILDSPFYDESDLLPARRRSEKYFIDAGFPEMIEHYHHHTFANLRRFHPRILYNPNSLFNKIKCKLSICSPFPWIMLSNEGTATS